MTDGARSVVGMCAGGFCAVLAAWLYFGGQVIDLLGFPFTLLWGGLFLLCCTLIGGLAGYCLGAGDVGDEDQQGG